MSSNVFNSLTKGMRGAWLAAVVAFLVGLPCAMLIPPLDRDESRFAQASSQMLETKDFINISYQDGPRHKKPVGIHWLQAASTAITSNVSERDILSYRWPSLFGAALAAFSMVWGAGMLLARKREDDEVVDGFDAKQTALIAGLTFGVSFLLSSEAFIAKTDAVLCGFTTLFLMALAKIYVTYRDRTDPTEKPKLTKYKLIFWLSFAASILIKGPIGPLMFVATAGALAGWDLRTKELKDTGRLDWLKHLGWVWGLLITLVMVGPWAIAITIATDGAFWGTAIGDDFAPKLVSGSEGHFAWPGLHTLLLPLLFFPGTFLLGGALQTAFTRYKDPVVRFAICWFLPAFLVFEASPTKLAHYPLPTYGGLALLAAISLSVPLKTWAKLTNVALGLFAGALITLISVYGLTEYGNASIVPVVTITSAAALLVSGLGALFLWRNHKLTGLMCLLGAGVAAHLGFVTILSQLKPLWMSRTLEQTLVDTRLDPREGLHPGPVATLGYAEPSFVFAMGTKTELADTADQAAAALRQGRPVFVEGRHDAEFKKSLTAAGLKARTVKVVKGYNYSNGDDVTITLYQLQP
ncbi:glycosyltransferase family 39 protein [Asticcacaulis sp. BYS171W]|uniref:Glycosyltransferase family 39 protein n=1 Tax=Asticcacaulis aquaticus TaxID=2984212 RepID=A0ABT5HVG8_9CAUL|nr:glycosyltransferase family 39 protein [Asticcacaulis aquaticus]MDC7684048.1 glycosyltransferase family 39 protein [Asticcacaulis aquaticus]